MPRQKLRERFCVLDVQMHVDLRSMVGVLVTNTDDEFVETRSSLEAVRYPETAFEEIRASYLPRLGRRHLYEVLAIYRLQRSHLQLL